MWLVSSGVEVSRAYTIRMQQLFGAAVDADGAIHRATEGVVGMGESLERLSQVRIELPEGVEQVPAIACIFADHEATDCRNARP